MLAAISQVWMLMTSKTLPAFCKTRSNMADVQAAGW